MLRQCDIAMIGGDVAVPHGVPPDMILRHTRSLPLLAALAGVAVAGSAHAQSQDDGSRHQGWSIGLAAAWSPSPYKRYDNKAWPLPLVNYEGKSFYFRGATIGYKLYSSPSDEISIAVSPNGDRFRHEDTRDPQLKQLSNRNIGAMAGFAWRHSATWGFIEANASKKVTGNGGGTRYDLGYGYAIPAGKLTLIPKVGISRSDSHLNNYYYGISAREAARSGLPFYRAGGGNAPYVDLSAVYRFTPKWTAIGGVRYSKLPDAIKNSPMVDADDSKSFFFAINRAF